MEIIIKRPWIERLSAMGLNECLDMEDTPRASIYTSVFQNKQGKLKGKKFRTQQDKVSGKWYVCRIK